MELGVYSGCIVGETLEDQLNALRELGYDFLELRLTNDEIDALDEGQIASIAKLAESTGMPIRSASVGQMTKLAELCADEGAREATRSRLMRVVKLCRRLEANVILLATKEEVPVEDALPAYSAGLARWADAAQEQGVCFALEHVGGYKPSEIEAIVRGVGHPGVGMYFDIGNALGAGEDHVECIQSMGDIMAAVHFKGRGDMPLRDMRLDEVRTGLAEHGYSGRGAVEIGGEGNNDHLREALAVLREFGL
ncbi:MAG: sugar phosphate isomerase/epimerase family protein [Armatimonadota bacterium]|jgi:sugar phosphate isomerase/epimerase